MTSRTNQKLQRNITMLCHYKGFKKKDVFDAVKIPNTKRNLTVDDLDKISQYLKVTILDFF
ncbi:hypothetical protein HJ158_25205 [Vibrio parahaemolyticus]|nr:hypothetical protein [Vibrio parahaemolyticus]